MKILEETHASDGLIEALEKAIYDAVQHRIDTDGDVADTYLRITPQDDGFMLKVMYIEESNLTSPNRDVPLLDLMIDLKGGCMGDEIFIPNKEAIHTLAEGYSTMISFTICQN